MANVLSKKLAKQLCMNGNIKEEEVDLYAYGFFSFFMYLSGILTSLLIGFVMNMFIESIIFLIMFMPLRSFAGGIHVSSYLKCYIISNIALISILYIINNLPIHPLAIFFDNIDFNHYYHSTSSGGK